MSLLASLPNIQEHVLLAPYTTYKIGGPADYFLAVYSKDELVQAITTARKEDVPYFILGTGANILISDKGYRGLVILNRAANHSLNGTELTVESGATIADLIEFTAQQNLSGLEHFAGIPSTVGGAIWQNLHFLSPDRSRTMFIEEILQGAEVLTETGEVKAVTKDFFEFGYDQSILHHNHELIVLEATFALTSKPEAEIRQQAEENLAWRRSKQHQLDEFPSGGSVFKKIENVGAGRLIEQAELKGYQIGGIQVSPQHANFLVNTGGATAADVRAMIAHIQSEVQKKTGYQLEPEISFVGEW